MLDENIQVVDIDADHWTRLLSLFKNERVLPNILLLIVEKNQCLKAINISSGAIRNFDYDNGNLEAIAKREGFDYVAKVGREFFQKAFDTGQRNVFFDDDYVNQLLSIYNGILSYTSENIEWWPAKPKNPSPLNYMKTQKVFNKFFPDQTTFLFLVLENNLPYTSLILGKRSGDICLLTTLDSVGMTQTPVDSHECVSNVIDAIEEKFEPVHLAFVIEKSSFVEMLAGPRPVTHLHGAMANKRAFIFPLSLKLRFTLWAARVFKKL